MSNLNLLFKAIKGSSKSCQEFAVKTYKVVVVLKKINNNTTFQKIILWFSQLINKR